jgi:hypothetical protein
MKLLELATRFAAPLLALTACGESDGQGGSRDTTGGSSGGTAGAGTSGGEGGTSGGGAGGGAEGGSAGTGAGGSGGTGEGCDPTSSGAGIAIPEDCEALNQCLQQACGASYTQCLGPNYSNGDYSGGACAGAFQCIQDCGCEPACSEQCYANDNTCIGCLAGLFLCGYECEDELAACEG